MNEALRSTDRGAPLTILIIVGTLCVENCAKQHKQSDALFRWRCCRDDHAHQYFKSKNPVNDFPASGNSIL